MQLSHAFAGAAAIANKRIGKKTVKPAGFQAQSIAGLARAIKKITARHAFLESNSGHNHPAKLPFNIAEIDAGLGGGLACNALHEIRTVLSRDVAAGSGFLFGLLALITKRRDGSILWVSDPAVRHDAGTLFPQGLGDYGFDPRRLILVNPGSLKSALWVAGEAASCEGLASVVLHVSGNPKALDLTATRKLQLTAHKGCTTIFILRQAGAEEASAGLTRWRVCAAPSLGFGYNNHTGKHSHLGPTRLALSLERNRNGNTGDWCLAWNPHERTFENGDAANFNDVPLPATEPEKPEPPTADLVRLPHSSDNRPDLSPEMGQQLAHKTAS